MDESLLRRLLATSPDEFIAARNAAVKELRKDGERDAATAVAALRRPSWPDWALNVVAGEDPAPVEQFADAAAMSRDAQAAVIEGRSGPDVRASLRDLRQAVAELAGRAGEVMARQGRPAAVAEVTSRLSQLAGDGATTEHLRAGVLGASGTGAADLLGALQPTAPARARASKRSPTATKAEKQDRAAERQAERSAAAERKARTAAAHQLERAEREHRGAMRELARADSAVESAGAEVEVAAAAVDAARRELTAAERRRDGAERKRAAVAETVERTKAALDEARREAERLSGRAGRRGHQS